MRKPILFFCSLLMSLSTWATEPEAVNVHQWSGAITSTRFDDFQNLELSGDVIIIHNKSGESTTIAMDNVTNILWGEYVQNSSTTDLDDLRPNALRVYHNGTQGVIESTDAVLHYAVFDALGRFICSGSPAAETYEVLFPAQSWAGGIYLVCIETTAGKSSSKIILP